MVEELEGDELAATEDGEEGAEDDATRRTSAEREAEEPLEGGFGAAPELAGVADFNDGGEGDAGENGEGEEGHEEGVESGEGGREGGGECFE